MTVYDKAADAYLEPYFVPTIIMGERMFRDAVNKAGHIFNAHPSDYSLYHIGNYNDADATFTMLPGPMHIMVGEQAVDKPTSMFSEDKADSLEIPTEEPLEEPLPFDPDPVD